MPLKISFARFASRIMVAAVHVVSIVCGNTGEAERKLNSALRHFYLLPILRTFACSALLVFPSKAAEPGPAIHPDKEYHWFAVPIEVTGLPPSAVFVPVEVDVDFSSIAKTLNVQGIVDERSLRLFPAGRSRASVPLQVSAKANPRPRHRQVQPGTRDAVGYLAEYPAGTTPEGITNALTLAWIASADKNGRAKYQLEFGILKTGIEAQVPYEPQNFRAFDAEGVATPISKFPVMQIRPQQPLHGVVNILEATNVVTVYHTGPTLQQVRSGSLEFHRPFLYPVNGMEGISLTEFGKPHDPTGSHAHHYSLWIAHFSVDGQDFWSERGGVIAHERFGRMEDGPVFCELVQSTLWIANATNVLREQRSLRVYRAAEHFRLMDFELQFSPATGKPVTFAKTTFGFLAARVNSTLSPFDGGGEILNSAGQKNEAGAHLQKADWLDQSGPISEGRWAGIAILDSPENPNHPTGWHCRNDGWAGAAFNMDAPFILQPQQSLKLRYRLVLHSGDAHAARVVDRFAEYATKPVLTLGTPAAIKR